VGWSSPIPTPIIELEIQPFGYVRSITHYLFVRGPPVGSSCCVVYYSDKYPSCVRPCICASEMSQFSRHTHNLLSMFLLGGVLPCWGTWFDGFLIDLTMSFNMFKSGCNSKPSPFQVCYVCEVDDSHKYCGA